MGSEDERRARREKDFHIYSSNCRSQSELYSEGEKPPERIDDELFEHELVIKDSESFKLSSGAIV